MSYSSEAIESPVPESTAEATKPVRGFQAIPQELKARPQWVCWRYVTRGGKKTKIPYRPRNPFVKASSDDPSTWGSYEEALKQYENRKRTKIDGIGFVFSPDDPYVGIDLDDCLVNGTIKPWAEEIVKSLTPSYGEISPSGCGVKIWVKGKLPGSGTRKTKVGPDKDGAIEMYDRERYFTTTGMSIANCDIIEDRSAVVLALYETIKPKGKSKPKPPGPRPPSINSPMYLSDEELMAKAMRAKNGGKLTSLYLNGDVTGFGSESEADLALACLIAFWTGDDHGRIERVFNRSALAQRGKWQDREDYRNNTIAKALELTTEFYEPIPQITPANSADPDSDDESEEDPGLCRKRSEVIVCTDEFVTNDQACYALSRDKEVYSRGGLLAEIIQEREPKHKLIIRPPGSLRIATMTKARIRDVLTRCSMFIKLVWNSETQGYDKVPAHPPDWCVAAVEARGQWPGVNPIQGIIETPILKPDGSILTKPGHDLDTFLFYRPGEEFPPIPDSPTLEDARRAAAELLSLVVDFPFVDESHRMAWLSAVLTPFARFAIYGPVPLHYFDANCRGTGKSLLIDLVAILFTGRNMPRTAYTDDDNELRKRITSVALGGDNLMLLDNVDVPFGGASIDAMLTAMTWRDRILGVSSMTAELPLFTCWYGSGNNTTWRGDITRRIITSRIETDQENPEARREFKIKEELPTYAKVNRSRLVVAALAILKAHHCAGSPTGDLVPMGSYEGWSKTVRSAIHWCTGVDPLESTAYLKKSDPESITRAALLDGWFELADNIRGVTASEAIKALKEHPSNYHALRSVLMEWSRSGELPSPRTIGMKLNAMRGRVIGGKRFVSPDGQRGSLLWKVETVQTSSSTQSQNQNCGTSGSSGTNPSSSREKFPMPCDALMDECKGNSDILPCPIGTSPASPASPAHASEVMTIPFPATRRETGTI